MIYLDNAATTYPKPLCVQQAVNRAFHCFGANPGRGGYRMALNTDEELYRCRETVAAVFGLSDERQVIFTSGCTASLNMVIDSIFADGGHAVVSSLEHNAVMRPLYAKARYDIATVMPDDDEATMAAFRRAITPKTRAIICTHASNVTGTVLPIRQIAAVAHEYGVPIVVDAAQSAGHLPLDLEKDELDYVCVAGHKGLYGPMGTGLLLCRKATPLVPFIRGGTGSRSLSLQQPEEYPERLESGTPNVPGICGLKAGMEWVKRRGIQAVAEYEHHIYCRLYEGLYSLRAVRIISPPPQLHHTTSVLSVTVDGYAPDEIGIRLAEEGVAVRTGIHCAPTAHRSLATLPRGTVRLSIGALNTRKEIEKCLQIFGKIVKYPLQFHV